MILDSLEFSQEYCNKHGKEKLIELLDNCAVTTQSNLGDFEE